MKTYFIKYAILMTSLTCLTSQAESCKSPEDKSKLEAVKQAYQRQSLFLHDKQGNIKFNNLSKSFILALQHNQKCTQNGAFVCALDFEPIFNAQDWDNPKVQYSCEQGQVITRIDNSGVKDRIRFDLVQQKGFWVFDDLHSKQLPSLKQTLLSQ